MSHPTIQLHNYEEFLIDYLHDELEAPMREEMQQFMATHPAVAEEYELLKQTILSPDPSIVFEAKHLLYKTEESKPVLSFKRYFAVAAAVIGIAIGLFFFLKPKPIDPSSLATAPKSDTPVVPSITPKKPMQEPTAKVIIAEKPQMEKQGVTKLPVVHRLNNPLPFPEEKEEKVVQNPNTETPITPTIPITPLREERIVEQPKPANLTQPNNPITEKIQEEKPEYAYRATSPSALEWNPKHQPKLFRAINGLLGLKGKVKQTTESLTNTEVVVMVGHKVLFNINN